MSYNEFEEITLKGNPTDIGHQHGEHLRVKIAKVIDLYLTLFHRMGDSATINYYADYYSNLIKHRTPQIYEEIRSIARASNQSTKNIILLNSRSEVINNLIPNNNLSECSTFYLPEINTLAENWDWMPEMLELSVILKIQSYDETHLITLTEAGMVGKIGLNSAGIGVGLNILYQNGRSMGLPIHILLRQLLKQKSYVAARQFIKQQHGQASHILLADGEGNASSVELSNKGAYFCQYERCPIHTNHYLNLSRYSDDGKNSRERYQRLKQLTKTKTTAKGALDILNDNINFNNPLLRPYQMGENLVSGTVASVIMHLDKKIIRIRKGNQISKKFIDYAL